MNVSVPAMTRMALVVMLLASCGDDPSLQIEVRRPTEPKYQQLITKTVVTVYEPELSSLTCEAIEFGDVTEDLLLGATVAQQTLHSNGGVDGTLDDISRVGRKLVVARLTTDTDVLIAAGCTEVGDLSGDVNVVVETEVAATVAVDTVSVDDPYAKQITVVDPLGDSLNGREVRWRVFGPAGSAPGSSTLAVVDPNDSTIWDSATPGCTDMRGIANMRMVPPAKVSGFAARFRVSWPSLPISLISGFVRPGVAVQILNDISTANRCAIRTAGEHRVVCVDNVSTVTPRGHRFELVQGPLKNWNAVDRGTVNLTSRPAGVFSVEETNGKEIYALLANGTVQNLFGTTSLTPSNCTDCAIDDFKVAPACGDDAGRIFMHSTTGKPIRVTPVRGGPVVDFGLPPELDAAGVVVALNNVGCVTTINANGVEKDVQVVILDITSAEGAITRGLFRCGLGRTCGVTLPFALAGVGFLKAGTATKPESQLVGTAFDIAGAELVGWVLRPTMDLNTYLLIDRQRIVAAAPPDNILVGKLDGDSEPDLVWTIRGARSVLMQVSYAHAIEDDSRLSALAPITSAIEEVAIGDATGDGFDDLLGVTAGNFVVLPQNVEGPTVADRTNESTCAQ